jgi:hypothetical protein
MRRLTLLCVIIFLCLIVIAYADDCECDLPKQCIYEDPCDDICVRCGTTTECGTYCGDCPPGYNAAASAPPPSAYPPPVIKPSGTISYSGPSGTPPIIKPSGTLSYTGISFTGPSGTVSITAHVPNDCGGSPCAANTLMDYGDHAVWVGYDDAGNVYTFGTIYGRDEIDDFVSQSARQAIINYPGANAGTADANFIRVYSYGSSLNYGDLSPAEVYDRIQAMNELMRSGEYTDFKSGFYLSVLLLSTMDTSSLTTDGNRPDISVRWNWDTHQVEAVMTFQTSISSVLNGYSDSYLDLTYGILTIETITTKTGSDGYPTIYDTMTYFKADDSQLVTVTSNSDGSYEWTDTNGVTTWADFDYGNGEIVIQSDSVPGGTPGSGTTTTAYNPTYDPNANGGGGALQQTVVYDGGSWQFSGSDGTTCWGDSLGISSCVSNEGETTTTDTVADVLTTSYTSPVVPPATTDYGTSTGTVSATVYSDEYYYGLMYYGVY